MIENSKVIIRKAISSESEVIERLHRRAFLDDPHEYLSGSIFVSTKISKYLSKLIEGNLYRPECDKTLFLVAYCADALAGYLSGRFLSQSFHINYIAVDPEFQGKGIARSMLTHLEEYCHTLSINSLSLDMHISSDAAFRLYKKWGFVAKYSTYVYPVAVETSTLQECSFEIVNWLDAEAWQHTYGFSRIKLSLNNSEVLSVGRLGDDYWRIDATTYLQHSGLPYALKAINANRSKILISSEQIIANFPQPEVTVLRMEKLL
jgi:ribosomal protein S18 acetylase RimI-like enzyme